MKISFLHVFSLNMMIDLYIIKYEIIPSSPPPYPFLAVTLPFSPPAKNWCEL